MAVAGTGTFMLCNTGVKAIHSQTLLTTIGEGAFRSHNIKSASAGFQFGSNAPVCYALEGSGSIGGNVRD